MATQCPARVQLGSVQVMHIRYSGMQVLHCLQRMANNFQALKPAPYPRLHPSPEVGLPVRRLSEPRARARASDQGGRTSHSPEAARTEPSPGCGTCPATPAITGAVNCGAARSLRRCGLGGQPRGEGVAPPGSGENAGQGMPRRKFGHFPEVERGKVGEQPGDAGERGCRGGTALPGDGELATDLYRGRAVFPHSAHPPRRAAPACLPACRRSARRSHGFEPKILGGEERAKRDSPPGDGRPPPPSPPPAPPPQPRPGPAPLGSARSPPAAPGCAPPGAVRRPPAASAARPGAAAPSAHRPSPRPGDSAGGAGAAAFPGCRSPLKFDTFRRRRPP
ncbi:basic proline-rich protein-like [Pezoporus flaviventris]|uniref:basic proline-rich protein-like n=1 Tax=Pezoporus flaviventris TaxID=889875 RepID=UPI002AB23778|nr:basic proline-rich protein-like [Pezoporus flaviventris]